MLYAYSSLLQIYEYLLQVVLYIGYFLLFRYLIQFLKKLRGGVISQQQRYSFQTSLPSPLKIRLSERRISLFIIPSVRILSKNLIKREKNKLVCSSEREDFIKIESTTKFAKIRIANLRPVLLLRCRLSYVGMIKSKKSTIHLPFHLHPPPRGRISMSSALTIFRLTSV